MRRGTIFAIAAGLVIAGAVTVVEARRGGFGRREQLGMCMAQLELTEAQQEQLQELRESMRAEMQAWRQSGERPDMEAVQARREKHQEELEAILTEAQLAQLRELRAEVGGPMWLGPGARQGMGDRGVGRPGWRGMWGHAPGLRPMAGMRERGPYAQLDLTEQQQTRIEELREKHRTEVEQLRARHREETEKVLTKEQREKLEQLKDDVFYGRGGPEPGAGLHGPRAGRP